MRNLFPLLVLVCTAAAAFAGLPLPGLAQQGAVQFKNFKQSGAGQYRQESQAMRNGQPVGAPINEVHCASAMSPQNMAAIKSMANTVASTCTTRMLADTPTLAEYEQTCNPGALQTVIHTTMRAVNDRVTLEDTRMTMGGQPGTETHSKVTYLGACTAAQNAANANIQVPTMPKPSKADCAEVAGMKQQESAMNCSEMPAAYRARCEAAKVQMQQGMKQMEAMCK